MIKIDAKELKLNEGKLKAELQNTNSELHKFFRLSLKQFNQYFVSQAKINAKGMNVGKGLVSYDEEINKLIGGLAAKNMAFYAPYVEFGTRGKVDVPQGWDEIAKKYKGKSKFKSKVSFEEAIKLWIKKKLKKSNEEAERLVFPIMMKILRVGTAPKPFMVPAYHKAEKFLMKELNKKIKNYLK
tara:strand:- start:11592 stop:12143 length:552 start_codon:yes stop_codon:yes gene_type:complete